MVRPLLSDRYLSVCNVAVLWPNGWMDQDETWHAGRPRPWPCCVRWGSSFPSAKGADPQFYAHICCGQMAAWIKMPFGMEVNLCPGDLVRWGPRSPSPKRGREPQIFGPCLLWPNGWMDQYGTWHGGRPKPRRLCVRRGTQPPPKKGRPQFRPISIVAKRLH